MSVHGAQDDPRLPDKTALILLVYVYGHIENRERYFSRLAAALKPGGRDAPALKKADIGIAMGQRGTQVAREAAAMVLKDDAFASIVAAVEQGRVIFDNIRRFVLYLLSCNVSEVLVVGLASFTAAPLPIQPLQILFLNLVTDVFPALALGLGKGDPQVMSRPRLRCAPRFLPARSMFHSSPKASRSRRRTRLAGSILGFSFLPLIAASSGSRFAAASERSLRR